MHKINLDMTEAEKSSAAAEDDDDDTAFDIQLTDGDDE